MRFELVQEKHRIYRDKTIILPIRSTSQSAGYDFYCPIDLVIGPKQSSNLIYTDICVKLEKDFFLMLVPRSSLGINKNLCLNNTIGIIDSDYYGNDINGGNIAFKFFNFSNKDVEIKEGEKIFQGIILPYYLTEDDQSSNIRNGGFGSTTKL